MTATMTKKKTAALAGLVRTLKQDKGYGFLLAPDGTEYFFHKSSCPQFEALTEGAAVRFVEGEPGAKGPRAERVELAS